MERGYYNIPLTDFEKAFSRYVCNYVKDKTGTKKINPIRLAKIIVDVTLGKDFPMRLLWLDMGIISAAQAQIPLNYNFDAEKGIIERADCFVSFKDINDAIDIAMIKFPNEMSPEEIRKKQYELLDDKIYLTKLELEKYYSISYLIKNKNKFTDLLSKFIAELPVDTRYQDLVDVTLEFAVNADALLNYYENSSEINVGITNSLSVILKYFSILNAAYKKIKGKEKLFITNEVTPGRITEELWTAKSSQMVLKQMRAKQPIKGDLAISQKSKMYEQISSEFITNLVE